MFTAVRDEPIEKIVMHVNVGPEVEGGALSLARFIRNQEGGYNRIADDKVRITCAADNLRVAGAPFMNRRGLHLCIIGQASQTAAEWHDAYSTGALNQAALVVVEWHHTHNIPIRKLTVQEVTTPGMKGLCGHVDVTNGFKEIAAAQGIHLDHWDPGPNFPWPEFIGLCQHLAGNENPAVPIVGKDQDMQVFIDTINSEHPDTRPRTAEVDQSGNIVLGNGAKITPGKAAQVGPVFVQPPGFATGEKYVSAQKFGPNGFAIISAMPSGSRAIHNFQFVK